MAIGGDSDLEGGMWRYFFVLTWSPWWTRRKKMCNKNENKIWTWGLILWVKTCKTYPLTWVRAARLRELSQKYCFPMYFLIYKRNSTKSRTGVRKWNFGCTGPILPQTIFLSFLVTDYMCLGMHMSKKAK